MTSDRDDLTKVTKHIHEAQTFGIAILPPDINESEKEFIAISRDIRCDGRDQRRWGRSRRRDCRGAQ